MSTTGNLIYPQVSLQQMRYEIKIKEAIAFNYIKCMIFSNPNLLESTFLVNSVDVFFFQI